MIQDTEYVICTMPCLKTIMDLEENEIESGGQLVGQSVSQSVSQSVKSRRYTAGIIMQLKMLLS